MIDLSDSETSIERNGLRFHVEITKADLEIVEEHDGEDILTPPERRNSEEDY